jgi:hypothetical protein
MKLRLLMLADTNGVKRSLRVRAAARAAAHDLKLAVFRIVGDTEPLILALFCQFQCCWVDG